MAKLTESPLTGTGAVKFSSNFMKLLFSFSFGATSHSKTADDMITALRGVSFELERINKTGQEYTVRKNSVLSYLEIGSNLSHGAVRIITTGDVTTCHGCILIGVDGDVVPIQNETFTARLYDMPTYMSCDIETIEVKKPAMMIFDYNKVNVTADTPAPVELATAHLLSLPKSQLSLLQIEDADARQLTLSNSSLEQLLSEINPNAFAINGLITPVGLDLYTYPVASIRKAYVTCATDQNLIVTNVKRA